MLSPDQKTQVSKTLGHDAEIMSNTQLTEQLAGQPPAVQAEIIRINTHARHRALEVALIIPTVAALLGFLNSFRMLREPSPYPRPPPTEWSSADTASAQLSASPPLARKGPTNSGYRGRVDADKGAGTDRQSRSPSTWMRWSSAEDLRGPAVPV